MKLEFNNIEEMVDFLKDIGYNVEKINWEIDKVFTGTGKKKGEEGKEEILDDWWKKIPQNPQPYNPYNPYNPYYPTYPIVTYDAMSDPHLSSKFPKCSK